MLHTAQDVAEPNHNVWQHGGAIVFNDTNQHAVVAVSALPMPTETRVEIPGESPFVRGLAHAGGHVFWAGSQAPLALYEVDVSAGRLLSSWVLDPSPVESVYAICPLPATFHTPASLVFSY